MSKNKIIGIISVPLENITDTTKCDMSYISDSHLSWLNINSIKLIVIPFNITNHKEIFESIDALYFPSNAVSSFNSKEYYDCCKKFIKLAIQSNNNGNYFPILGICYGMEQMLIVGDGNDNFNLLEEFNSYNTYLQKLILTDIGNKSSKIINYINKTKPYFLNRMINNDILLHEHKMGLSSKKFNESVSLKRFYNIISINYDRDNKEFISIIESKKYPFYGYQWHPEQSPDNDMNVFIKFFINEVNKTPSNFKNKIFFNLKRIKLDCLKYSSGIYKKCVFYYSKDNTINDLKNCNVPVTKRK